MRRRGGFRHFERARTREARGGIKARTTRGRAFGESWWSRRFVEALERFTDKGRLSRGRTYARKGQVLDLQVAAGQVEAKVQGSRPRPYEVTIRARTLPAAAWAQVVEALAVEALLAAKLLAGELPAEVEDVVRGAGVELLPAAAADLTTACSCPDWSRPCKHVAAVYCLLAEELDRDPFLLLLLRGLERDALLAQLGAATPAPAPAALAAPAAPAAPAEPLEADPARFWGAAPTSRTADHPADVGPLRAPETPAAVTRSLGGFPLWRGEVPLQRWLEEVYPRASQAVLQRSG